MKNLFIKITIGAFLAVVVFAIISFGSCALTKRKYENGFSKIEVGNSKQYVTDLLGEPKEIEICRRGENCKDSYVYYSFMERWGVSFDSHDSVVHKYYNVSY